MFAVPVQQHHNLHKRVVRVLGDQKRNGCAGRFSAYYNRTGFGRAELLFILGIRQKTDITLLGPSERRS
jgi:hypothetical protein